MREIIGNITATPIPRSDWAQTDPTKVDYIKNKITKLSELDNDITLDTTQIIHGDAEALLASIIEDYILNINYETLSFDTSELVIGGAASGASSSILGTGMLGYLVLA